MIDRSDVLAAGVFIAGLAILVFVVIPRVEFAIAAYDRVIGRF